jgi:hypothetical protein
MGSSSPTRFIDARARRLNFLSRRSEHVVDDGFGTASDNILPRQKRPKLIVVVAFDRGEDGEMFPAFGPADQQSEDRAIRTARALAEKHVGLTAWSREANPDIGAYGPLTTLSLLATCRT